MVSASRKKTPVKNNKVAAVGTRKSSRVKTVTQMCE
jgi:hypothetical protein